MAALFIKNDEMNLEFFSAYSSRAESEFLGPRRISDKITQKIKELNTTKKRSLSILPAEDEAIVILTNKLFSSKLLIANYLEMPIAIIDRVSANKVKVALLQEVSKFKQDGQNVTIYDVVSGVFELCCDSRGFYYE